MFVQERQDMILSLINKNGKVIVKDLSEQFQVTEDCIRKDLATLEKKGLLTRAYGGAVLNRVNTHQDYVAQRKEQNTAAKRTIAEKAAALIHNGDMVFLDISTSNIELANVLAESGRQVTVVTNMVEIMHVLTAPSEVNLTFIGGTFNCSRDAFVGGLTADMLSMMRYDLAFMGAVGIDAAANAVYTYMPEDGYTKKAAMRSSKQCYLLTETEKFSAAGNFKYAGLDAFHGIITEAAPSVDIQKKLEEYQIETI